MSNKSDEEILVEAREAQEKVVQANLAVFAQSMRPKLKKAFPFGPKPSKREREIYQDLLKETLGNLEFLAKTFVLSVCLFVVITSPAMAQENNELKEVQILDKSGMPFAVVEPATYDVPKKAKRKKKTSFAQKHPKIHKAARTTRRTVHYICKVGDPVVRFAGSCAQLYMAITGH